jgi:hypothetical protein
VPDVRGDTSKAAKNTRGHVMPENDLCKLWY